MQNIDISDLLTNDYFVLVF